MRPSQTERSRSQPSACSSICSLSVAERQCAQKLGAAGREEPLQELRANGNGHLRTYEEPGDQANSAICLANKITIPVCVLIIIALGAALVGALIEAFSGIANLYSVHPGSTVVHSLDPPPGPWCLDGWVGYQGKCYYFSEAKENWTYSQSNCSAHGASLAVIDSEQEMRFLRRCKGKLDHWLGLWREQDQDPPWKWVNGTKFNNW
ncbi:early activation antigen CD69-like isoform X2 [Gopherus evgoodei]|nr:early activation antigen CD69-like isoform X2 [Gopherus evgoodei]